MTGAVLVTRPPDTSAGFITALHCAGWETCEIPMLEIQPLSAEHPQYPMARDAVENLDRFHRAIVVSVNAVNHGVGLVDQYWPQFPRDLQWYAVGPATAKALAGYVGETTHPLTGMNSESLLALPSLQMVDGERIAIFRGVGGRTLLGDTLMQRGAEVTYIALYERSCPDSGDSLEEAIRDKKIAVVTVASGETLDNLVAVATRKQLLPELYQLPLLVPGARVTEMAERYGFQQVMMAPDATVEMMIKTLDQWREK